MRAQAIDRMIPKAPNTGWPEPSWQQDDISVWSMEAFDTFPQDAIALSAQNWLLLLVLKEMNYWRSIVLSHVVFNEKDKFENYIAALLIGSDCNYTVYSTYVYLFSMQSNCKYRRLFASNENQVDIGPKNSCIDCKAVLPWPFQEEDNCASKRQPILYFIINQ